MACTSWSEDEEGAVTRWDLQRSLLVDGGYMQFMQTQRALVERDNDLAILEREASALTILKEILDGQISEFQTSLDEDQELLGTSLKPNHLHAVRARRMEKLCLHEFRDLSHLLLEALETTAGWEQVESRFWDWDGFQQYMQDMKDLQKEETEPIDLGAH
jgi:hypothetical protein